VLTAQELAGVVTLKRVSEVAQEVDQDGGGVIGDVRNSVCDGIAL